jgi:hypothetical protein
LLFGDFFAFEASVEFLSFDVDFPVLEGGVLGRVVVEVEDERFLDSDV